MSVFDIERKLARERRRSGSRIVDPSDLSRAPSFGGRRLDPIDIQEQITVGSGEVLEQLRSNARLASRIPQGAIAGRDRSLVDQIASFGISALQKSGLATVLEFLDRPWRTGALAMLDIAQIDQQHDEEIGLTDYWNVITGKHTELEKDLGTDLVGVGANLSGSLLLDRLGVWQEGKIPFTDQELPSALTWPGKVARFIGSVGLQAAGSPDTYLTGGLSGLGRAAARSVTGAAVRTAGRRVFQIASEAADVTAARAALRASELSTLERAMAGRILSRTDDLLETGTRKLSYKEALDEAAGFTRHIEVISPATGKPIRVEADDEMLRKLRPGEEFQAPRGVIPEAEQELAAIIETKRFDGILPDGSESDWWRTWINHAQEQRNLLWTTGGLRIGFLKGTIAHIDRIPGVETRGLVRRGQLKVGKAIRFDRLRSTRQFSRLEDIFTKKIRPKFGGEMPERIAAIKTYARHGDIAARESYSTVRAIHHNTDALWNRLGIDDFNRRVAGTVGQVEKTLREADLSDEVYERALREWQDATSSSKMPVFSDPLPSDVVTTLARASREIVNDHFQVLKRVALLDPEFEPLVKAGPGGLRPIQFTEDYRRSIVEFLEVNASEAIPPLGNQEEKLEWLARLNNSPAMKGQPPLTEAELDVWLDSGGNLLDIESMAAARSIGHAAPFRHRTLGSSPTVKRFENEGDEIVTAWDPDRGTYLVEPGSEVWEMLQLERNHALNSELNEALMRVTRAVFSSTDAAPPGRWKRVESALVMDPAEQMARYITDVRQTLYDRIMLGEMVRYGMATRRSMIVRPGVLLDRMVTTGWLDRLNKVIEEVDLAGGEIYEAAYNAPMKKISIAGQELEVSEDLANSPGLQASLRDLHDTYRAMREVKESFGDEYDRLVRRLMNRFEGMEDAQPLAESLALHHMLEGLGETREAFFSRVRFVIDETVDHVEDAASITSTMTTAELSHRSAVLKERYLRQMQDVFDQYERAYMEEISGRPLKLENLNVVRARDVIDAQLRELNERSLRQATEQAQARIEELFDDWRKLPESDPGRRDIEYQVYVYRHAVEALHRIQGVNTVPRPIRMTGQTPPGAFEVSTAGNELGQQFSALNARLADGSTVEQVYQVNIKGYESIEAGKGRPPVERQVVNDEGDVVGTYVPTRQEMQEEYENLWRQWAHQHEGLLRQLWRETHAKGIPLHDRFAREGTVSQADALDKILRERYGEVQLNVAPVPVQKIISGGQDGADFYALLVGERAPGITTGGRAPNRFLSQRLEPGRNLPDPELKERFGLEESEGGYQQRTIENVVGSDTTVVFYHPSFGKSSGTEATIRYAADGKWISATGYAWWYDNMIQVAPGVWTLRPNRNALRPVIAISRPAETAEEAAEQVAVIQGLLREQSKELQRPLTVNVAGPRRFNRAARSVVVKRPMRLTDFVKEQGLKYLGTPAQARNKILAANPGLFEWRSASVTALKKRARALGIKGYSKMRKQQLVDAIEKKTGIKAPPTEQGRVRPDTPLTTEGPRRSVIKDGELVDRPERGEVAPRAADRPTSRRQLLEELGLDIDEDGLLTPTGTGQLAQNPEVAREFVPYYGITPEKAAQLNEIFRAWETPGITQQQAIDLMDDFAEAMRDVRLGVSESPADLIDAWDSVRQARIDTPDLPRFDVGVWLNRRRREALGDDLERLTELGQESGIRGRSTDAAEWEEYILPGTRVTIPAGERSFTYRSPQARRGVRERAATGEVELPVSGAEEAARREAGPAIPRRVRRQMEAAERSRQRGEARAPGRAEGALPRGAETAPPGREDLAEPVRRSPGGGVFDVDRRVLEFQRGTEVPIRDYQKWVMDTLQGVLVSETPFATRVSYEYGRLLSQKAWAAVNAPMAKAVAPEWRATAINSGIPIAEAERLWYAWRLTGDPRYLEDPSLVQAIAFGNEIIERAEGRAAEFHEAWARQQLIERKLQGDWQDQTNAMLDELMRELDIAGRSKARTKQAKISLIESWREAQPRPPKPEIPDVTPPPTFKREPITKAEKVRGTRARVHVGEKVEGGVYIGRVKGNTGTIRGGQGFGNPFVPRRLWRGKRHEGLTLVNTGKGDKADTLEAVRRYRELLWDTIESDDAFAAKVRELHGQDLWYPGTRGAASHGDVLAEAAERLHLEKGRPPDLIPVEDVSVIEEIPRGQLEARMEAWYQAVGRLYEQQARKVDSVLSHYEPMMLSAEYPTALRDLLDIAERLHTDDLAPEAADALEQALGTFLNAHHPEISFQVRKLFGPDAELQMVRVEGRSWPLVSYPGADMAALEKRGATMRELMDQLDAGTVTADDLARDGLEMVVFARNVRDNIKALRGVDTDFRSEPVKFFDLLVDHIEEAFRTHNARNLRNYVAHPIEGGFKPTNAWQTIVRELSANGEVEMLERLYRWMNAAWLADSPSWPDAKAFQRWWMAERGIQGSMKWSLDKNAQLIRQNLKLAMENSRHFPIEEFEDTGRFLETLFSELASLRRWKGVVSEENAMPGFRQGARLRDVARLEFVEPELIGRVGAEARGERAADVLHPRNAGKHATIAETLLAIQGSLDWLSRSRIPAKNKAATIGQLADEIRDILDTEYAQVKRIPGGGFERIKAEGVETGVLSSFDLTEVGTLLFDTTMNQLKVLHSPFGMRMIRDSASLLEQAWRRWATVVRPSFHIRNVLGGTVNGFLIGVGPSTYREIVPQVMKFRQAIKKLHQGEFNILEMGVTDDVFEKFILGEIDEPYRAAFRAAWEDQILQTSFSRADLMLDYGGKTVGPHHLLRPENAWYKAGGRTMETLEDVMRMAAYYKYFDPEAPASRVVAKTMVNTVHFDYTNLTQLERNIKKWVPFYVWTRRNIPLQLSVLMQSPGFLMLWERARINWNQEFANEDDPFYRYQFSQGWVLPYRRGNSDAFAQLMWNPDLPFMDIAEFPIWNPDPEATVPTPQFTNFTAWSEFIADNLGPIVSIPKRVFENTDAGSTNAPAGIDTIMRGMNLLPLVNVGDDVGGTMRWSRANDQFFHSFAPFYEEYRALLGVKPNSPNRRSSEGYVPGQDAGLGERVVLGPLGRSVGRGLGFEWGTPTDLFFEARTENERLREIAQRLRMSLATLPDQ